MIDYFYHRFFGTDAGVPFRSRKVTSLVVGAMHLFSFYSVRSMPAYSTVPVTNAPNAEQKALLTAT